jgi:prepilin-type N-terminal cleavage/methylation domain-containing protein
LPFVTIRTYLGKLLHRTGDARSAQAGFTLIEVLVATMILIVGLTALLGLLDVTVRASAATRAREGATSLAREIVEDARTTPYSQISPSSIEGQLQALNGLADASPETAGWQVVRRGVTYTVAVSECSIDDPKDGYGKHDSTFCADSSTEGETDPQPADLKRITVDVKWSAQGRTPSVHEVSTLTAAGEAPGLSASGLKLKTPEPPAPSIPTAPVIQQSISPLVFSVSSPAGTAAMSWSLDGSAQTPAPTHVSGTEWTFEWPITGLSDGTYQVSAQAIDTTGVTGPPVSITVNLIRGEPMAPKGILGGFNTINVSGSPQQVAELQWHANTERNVIGYRVYAPGNGMSSNKLICPTNEPTTLSVALSCIDFSPPSPNAANLTYRLVALYHGPDGVEVKEGPAASFTLNPTSATTEPNKPTGLEATKNENGSVTLHWSAPVGGQPPIFYRIYRGSTNYTSRYDVSSGTSTTYTDSDAVTPHTYWVTAVDASLTESPFSNSVVE